MLKGIRGRRWWWRHTHTIALTTRRIEPRKTFIRDIYMREKKNEQTKKNSQENYLNDAKDVKDADNEESWDERAKSNNKQLYPRCMFLCTAIVLCVVKAMPSFWYLSDTYQHFIWHEILLKTGWSIRMCVCAEWVDSQVYRMLFKNTTYCCLAITIAWRFYSMIENF